MITIQCINANRPTLIVRGVRENISVLGVGIFGPYSLLPPDPQPPISSPEKLTIRERQTNCL